MYILADIQIFRNQIISDVIRRRMFTFDEAGVQGIIKEIGLLRVNLIGYLRRFVIDILDLSNKSVKPFISEICIPETKVITAKQIVSGPVDLYPGKRVSDIGIGSFRISYAPGKIRPLIRC